MQASCPAQGAGRARRRTLIATEETLLHPSRNPHLTREQIEAELSEMLGLDKVIWLHKGMAGDDAVRPLALACSRPLNSRRLTRAGACS
jgi:agmatine/peptidylarginine deiminase